jgi:triphosphoribosyl-dephospho-CoA synthase
MLSIGLCAQLACVWEASARKPGNVHRYRDFGDAGYVDFLLSAAAIAPVLEAASSRRVGQTILDAIRATRAVVSTNTNLGIVLLLAPLAAVPRGEPLGGGLRRVLDELDVADARLTYEAIRLAAPAGLGRVIEQDVSEDPTRTLREVMALAADRDLVARQYVDGFQAVLQDGLPALREAWEAAESVEAALVACHVRLLASYPDSLIARKRGQAEAEEASQRARQVIAPDSAASALGRAPFDELDAWLCAQGNARNPGTTADMVAASLFAALREDIIQLPVRRRWAAEPR